jgi:leucyl-tRNA synthetase
VFRIVTRHAERLRGVAVGNPASADLATASAKEKILLRKAHQTLRRVTQDFEARWHFNTSVALIMELVNELQAQEPLEQDARPAVVKEVIELMALMLAPMAPHIAEELWEMLGHSGGLGRARWPDYQPQLAAEEQVEVVIQVNGRVRGKILVEAGLPEGELVKRAQADARIAQVVAGRKIAKRIVVPDKLVNLVLES